MASSSSCNYNRLNKSKRDWERKRETEKSKENEGHKRKKKKCKVLNWSNIRQYLKDQIWWQYKGAASGLCRGPAKKKYKEAKSQNEGQTRKQCQRISQKWGLKRKVSLKNQTGRRQGVSKKEPEFAQRKWLFSATPTASLARQTQSPAWNCSIEKVVWWLTVLEECTHMQ